jgi:hypothetical protein
MWGASPPCPLYFIAQRQTRSNFTCAIKGINLKPSSFEFINLSTDKCGSQVKKLQLEARLRLPAGWSGLSHTSRTVRNERGEWMEWWLAEEIRSMLHEGELGLKTPLSAGNPRLWCGWQNGRCLKHMQTSSTVGVGFWVHNHHFLTSYFFLSCHVKTAENFQLCVISSKWQSLTINFQAFFHTTRQKGKKKKHPRFILTPQYYVK